MVERANLQWVGLVMIGREINRIIKGDYIQQILKEED